MAAYENERQHGRTVSGRCHEGYVDANEITLSFYKYNTASPAQDLYERNISAVCSLNKTLSIRLRELFIIIFRSQFKGSFSKVVVTRAGRLREWSQGERAPPGLYKIAGSIV